jgi:hypothetical protein
MRRAFSSILLSSSIVFTGCGTLLPESSVSADPSISENDVREIERLLPVVGVRHPITGITRQGPNTYSVTCDGRHFSEWTHECFFFTVYRRHGRWIADKSSVTTGVGYITQ